MNEEEIIKQAVSVLRAGGVILYPSDTIWGIGCDATNPEAVAKIFAIKHREDSKSLVTLASDLDMVARYVKVIPPMAIDLVEVNDSPMTIIYPGAIVRKSAQQKGPCLAASCVAEDGSVGMRIPGGSEFCMKLLAAFRKPIVSTSANISGEATPAGFADISDAVKEGVDYIVEPHCQGRTTGKSSQIIKVDLDGGIKIIRG